MGKVCFGLHMGFWPDLWLSRARYCMHYILGKFHQATGCRKRLY